MPQSIARDENCACRRGYSLAAGISLTESAPAAMDSGPSSGHKKDDHLAL